MSTKTKTIKTDVRTSIAKTGNSSNNWRTDKQVVVYFGMLLDDLKELISDTLTTWINIKNNEGKEVKYKRVYILCDLIYMKSRTRNTNL